MIRLSLKWKLTLLYTFFMILVICVALGILFSLSSREVLTSTQTQLEKQVARSTDDIDCQDGTFQIDRDFYSVEEGVYLSVYDQNGYFLYGKIPYGFDLQPDFYDGETQRISYQGTDWYVCDLLHILSDGTQVYLRGITSVTAAEESFRITLRFALILLPLLAVLMVLIGYRFTRRALLPVRHMTKTVQQIQADADLSRRISRATDRPQGKDEIDALALTFNQMLAQLEEVFQREKQFTSDVSHELRTPVSVILAQCDALLAQEDLSPSHREQVEVIRRKGTQMAGMISSLLLLSRADAGRQPLSLEWLDVSELTELVVEEQQLLAQENGKGIHIQGDIAPHIHAWIDEHFFIRLLINLISNGVQYGKDQGSVQVALRCQGDQLWLTVSDDGIGIPPQALPHIWERFYRVDGARTDGSHSGLGLSMVRWIVQAHGGTVTAESTFGQGSCFRCVLPLGTPPEKKSPNG